jgi:diguanylate cyclase (GGDEF)-like protein
MVPSAISQDAGERLLDMVNDGAMVLDREGCVLWANRAIRELLGVSDALRGCRITDLLRLSVPVETLLSQRSDENRAKWLVANAARSGAELLISAHYRPQTAEFTVVARLFSSAVSNFDRVISFATRDDVTQLLNRDAFEERLAAAIEGHEGGCVICADVDQFSTINEVYGHAEGDALLRAVAQRIRMAVGRDLTMARLYGGRFAAFIPADSDQGARKLSAETAERLHQAMLPLFSVYGGVQPISLSIGVARWRIDGTTADDVIAAAETALHAVHGANVEKTRWFESAMMAERRRFFETEAELRLAIEQNALTLHYQPKVDAVNHAIVGFEALVRWVHPTKGMISPGFFVSVAEQSNLIIDLGRWVLREACRQQAAWRAQGLRLVPVAVNVSPQQLLSQPISALLAPLAEFGIPLDLIEIEITESAMMDRLPSDPQVIESLRASGLHISIDDFGTGHSSLGNLRRLPIDVLKIDRSFVEDIDRSREAYDIVATIVAMARTMSLNLVAEGVETEEQAALLRAHGVEVMQGFLFHKPMPGESAGRLLGTAGQTT